MNFFKKVFLRQVNRFKNVQKSDEIYFIFCRLVQVTCLASLISSVYAIFWLAQQPYESLQAAIDLGFSSQLVIAYYVPILGTLLSSEVILRFLDKESMVGFYLGILLSLKMTFSFYCPLGLFGLYCLLNPKAQKRRLKTAPSWLRDLLSFLKINFIETVSSVEATVESASSSSPDMTV